MKNKKIVITTDGKETIARLYDGKKVIKSATAKCSPDDTFDFNIGAKLAFERLMNEEKKLMTFREKLAKEHPACVNENYVGGCASCPYRYGYEKKDPSVCDGTWSNTKCTKCWDRVIPEQKAKKKEEPKYYNGKVVCVQCDGHGYTVGKVYEFKDGTLVDDDGDVRYRTGRIKHPNDIVRIYKFIPYVE